MKTVKIGNSSKFARPARRVRGSQYDTYLDAALALETPEAAVVETYETPEEATTAINGIRGRRQRRGLVKAIDLYMAADELSVVLQRKFEDVAQS